MNGTTTSAAIFASLQLFGEKNADPAIVEKYSRYFREGYDAYGLAQGLVKEKVTELLALPGMNQEMALELSLLLVKSPKYEMTALAILLLQAYHKQWTPETFLTVEKWFAIGITNWAQTDYICGELMNLFFKKGLVSLPTLEPWRTAPGKFRRRAAVVSLIKPMKISTDFTPWFTFIEPMMHDPAREVHQGLGWFLREAWKKQPGPTENFLFRYKDTAPRLIFQYATEKMTPEGKEMFRKKK